jgi:nitrate reductase gamma subunit
VEHRRGIDLHHRWEYNYRAGVSVWHRFLAFQPDASLMADALIGFQLHALAAFLLFALWPFTRLVHVFSARSATSPVSTSSTQPRPPARQP